MMIQNQSYGFTPPGGSSEIRITGAQRYSPGQTKKSDIWLVSCPEEYAGRLRKLGQGESYGSYAEVLKVLADAFFDGDVSRVVISKPAPPAEPAVEHRAPGSVVSDRPHYQGSQWAVNQELFWALPPERYDFQTRRIGEIEDWGSGPIYTFPVHMAEKEWVDIEDFIEVFQAAWSLYGALLPAPLDKEVMERTVRQARKVAERGY